MHSASMMGWWHLRHGLAVREVHALRRSWPSCHPDRWVLTAWLGVLALHTPDRRGRCPACASGPRLGWQLRRPHCRLVTTLLTAHDKSGDQA